MNFPVGQKLNGMVEALRNGGHLQVNVGGQSRSWRLDQTATVMGAVQDCRKAASTQ